MQRAKIVLLAAKGQENKHIANALGVTRQLVGRWRNRYVTQGLAGIEKDAPGRGARRRLGRRSRPGSLNGPTRCSRPTPRTGARGHRPGTGHHPSMVNRVWRANQLKPHLYRTFKLSNDPKFIERATDVVGLYRQPVRTRSGALLRRKEPDSGMGPGIAPSARAMRKAGSSLRARSGTARHFSF